MDKWLALFWVRVAISAGVMLLGIYLARRWWSALGGKCFLAYYALRLAGAYVLICVLNIVPSDLSIWAEYYAPKVIGGEMPGVDFLTFYFIGFHYVTAFATYLFHSPFGIACLFTACEMLALICWFRVLRNVWGSEIATKGVVLYLSSPFATMVSFMSAQDEPLFLLGMAAYLYFVIVESSPVKGAITTGLAVLCTKMTVGLYLAPVVLLKGYKGLGCFAAIFCLYCLCSVIFGVNPFNIQVESGGVVAQRLLLGSIWYFFPHVSESIQVAVFLLFGGVWGLLLLPNLLFSQVSVKHRLTAIALMTVGVELIFSLTYHTVYNAYILPSIPFLILLCLGRFKLQKIAILVVSCWMMLACFKDPFLYGFHHFHISGSVLPVLSFLYLILTVLILLYISVSHREDFSICLLRCPLAVMNRNELPSGFERKWSPTASRW